MILENINKELRNKLQLQQSNNTTAVINWFKKIEDKNKYKFMIFDIKDFYSSISKKLLDDSINFARQHVQIKREDFSIIQHGRKSLLYNEEIPWQKKDTNLFDIAMGAYDGAEVSELVGLFLLNSLANKFDKKCVGLYRDDVLVVFRNNNGYHADKTRKEFYQLFKANGLSLEIQCNLKTVNYLDITLDLNSGTYKPYRKPNDEILYIQTKSNHPANIVKQLPISIETRLPNLSSNPEIFHEASMHYQNILNQSGYDYKRQYEPPNNENENRSKSPKNRKRNIIWFNTPFSKNISNNIGKDFLPFNPKTFSKRK